MATRRSSDTTRTEPTRAAEARRRPSQSKKSPPAPARLTVTMETRHAMIAESAYLRAERRGFAPGHETDDWLAAEAEVDALLKAGQGGSPQ